MSRYLKCFLSKFKTVPRNSFNPKKFYSNATSVSDRASFPGYKGDFSTSLDFIYPETNQQIQCYRVMNRKGDVLDPNQDPQVETFLIQIENKT